MGLYKRPFTPVFCGLCPLIHLQFYEIRPSVLSLPRFLAISIWWVANVCLANFGKTRIHIPIFGRRENECHKRPS